MGTIGFLHTADVHVATFRALVGEVAPGWRDRHVVDPGLLADARAGLPVEEGVRARLAELAGCDVIVCTCSTIGPEAERAGVLRGDRPMAQAAVAVGGRIAVAYAVESTREPTTALLLDADPAADLLLVPCLAAWEYFESGDLPAYYRGIADQLRDVEADVVVLAQPSMAPAADLLPGRSVLSSPRAAVVAAVRGR
ncbi:hypothetical protein ACWT_0571 [Actinoplanes sp. SE50]|uniref:hypothetical protein n=1 Tax=unclassified Actinoplanes TaxID=2626549 RepID=UPI00023ECDE6|nr:MULTISPECIES: hypothetical protein [unclassified Actinoplanes]AEV81585.1 hypothetical protein ACPL_688 [Actinoplanes sp. SE50/110]ATO79986.1 hypothetical protein ACWT_0571 [Actinoplanes sp. SE50]SLL97389.1 hypothetical protein ACSP50_0592 [Actinoplanes sp. SE50/110]